MKKIFTLLFCTAVVSSAFAQTNRRDWDNRNTDVAYNSNDHQKNFQHQGSDRRDNNYTVYQNTNYSLYQRDQLLQKINSRYNYQVQQVMNDCNLSRWQKKNAIDDLTAQKNQDVNNINCQYTGEIGYNSSYQGNNGYQRHDNRDDACK